MYSIVQLCEKGYKIRYASNNLEEIYKIYNKLTTISPNKLHIFDDINNNFITFIKKKFNFSKFITIIFINLLLYFTYTYMI